MCCKIFDAHCDTVYLLAKSGAELKQNRYNADIKRMIEYSTYIQVFAAFVDKKEIKIPPMRHCLNLVEKYRAEVEKNRDLIKPLLNLADLENAKKDGGVYSILSIEGGEAFEGSLTAVKKFYDMGVRLVTLTWNYANELADGITESRGGGLTQFGREAVGLMEKLGIMIDVSHISEKGFWDVAEVTEYPFVASHSCVKKLCGHRRNLNDEQIDAIINRGGVIGVNFFPEFLSDSGVCTADKIAEHIEYIISRGGMNSVAFGSDFDGVDSLPSGVYGVESMKHLTDILRSRGLSDEDVDKVAFGNLFNLFRDMFERTDATCVK